MHKQIKLINKNFVIMTFFIFCFTGLNFAYAEEVDKSKILIDNFPEVINSFRSDITVNKDGTISVVETILYDAKDQEKHGIYRDINSTKVVGARRYLDIRGINVTGENGEYYPSDNSYGDIVRIKIGDPDSTFSGKRLYKIYYKGLNAIGYFDDRDEIYWNATGNEWLMPILEAEAHVYLPGEFTKEKLHIASYCGALGSKDPCISSEPIYNQEKNTTEIVFNFKKDTYLDIGSGMTVAVGFPKGVVPSYSLSWYEKAEYYWMAIGVISFLFVLFLIKFIFGFYLPEMRKRKEPIIAEYTPPSGISPAGALYIYKFKTEVSQTITVDILYLASLGYLTISDNKKDIGEQSWLKKKIKMLPLAIVYIIIGLLGFGIVFMIFGEILAGIFILIFLIKIRKIFSTLKQVLYPHIFTFTKTEKSGDKLPNNLKLLLKTVTGGDSKKKTTKEIEKDEDYDAFQDIKDKLESKIDSTYSDIKKYKENRDKTVDQIPFFIFTIISLSILLLSWFSSQSRSLSYIPFIAGIVPVVAILLLYFYFIIKRIFSARIYKHFSMRYKILGLREYIKVAEKDRLIFANNPEKSLKIFGDLLPYAMVFGFEEKWTNLFAGIIPNPPEWYKDSDTNSFSAFSSSLGAFSASMSAITYTGSSSSSGGGFSSGSSGGGSSGGGGGGGGGGSW